MNSIKPTTSARLAWFVGRRFGGSNNNSQLVSFIAGISTVGLVLGVAMLVVVVAIMNGFDRDLRTKILSVVPQASLFHRDGIENWPQEIERISTLPGYERVEAAAPFVHLEGMISRGKTVIPALVYGVDPVLEADVSHITDYLHFETLQRLGQEPNSFVLGKGLAEKLSVAVGDTVSFIAPKPNGRAKAAGVVQLKIIALLETGTELDHKLGVMSLNQASKLTTIPGTVTGIRLRLYDLFDAPWVVSGISRQLPYGYYTSDWTRTHGNLYHAVQMSSSLVSLLLVLIIGIAVFNVVSTLVLAVVEKQGDIAILRTMGASPGDILRIFMVQGSVVGLLGTGIGVLVGLGLSWVAPHLLVGIEQLSGTDILRSDIYPVSDLPIDNRWQDIVFITIVALVLSFFASIYPAWKASKIQPAEALRYD